MSEDKVTYVTYNAGIDGKHLHLGNLVHDYQNPSFYEPYVEKAYTDIKDSPPAWAERTSLGNYALTLGKGSEQGHAAPQSASHAAAQRYRVAASEKTTRIEIKDPEDFFREVTLSSPSARRWLSSHLSAAETLAQWEKPSARRPAIWMLTGLILMQHATWTSLSSSSSSSSNDAGFVTGKQAPFHPAGVSSLRRLSLSENVKPTFGFRGEGREGTHVEGATIHETGKYPGTRGWAAQWQRLEFLVGGPERWKAGVKELVRLKDGVAMVRIDEDAYAGIGGGPERELEEVDFDEAYWDAFVDAID
ncbi:hypothetical protein MBM_06691 [Drepanopeziza brunnea f. sp. 'multigermtubi' MB_m1]|uniref:Uncharacterized protein n=2 Tax=Drepanopeziza brunnea f. sp. 'multigermtubi' TaxID=698441 RepID=K1WC15_MARBU|nr:uncharacterized protein MBM_06691 [Drepanopeziza brunnea f. sp. 'multigermtubi' MB_m1]EKD14930.1 hypothetical protein MBM_06691 [Drepanopeziza brunnea f. sp. 'multigermtubi' MB_m1]